MSSRDHNYFLAVIKVLFRLGSTMTETVEKIKLVSIIYHAVPQAIDLVLHSRYIVDKSSWSLGSNLPNPRWNTYDRECSQVDANEKVRLFFAIFLRDAYIFLQSEGWVLWIQVKTPSPSIFLAQFLPLFSLSGGCIWCASIACKLRTSSRHVIWHLHYVKFLTLFLYPTRWCHPSH